MKCVICKQGQTQLGRATLTLERNQSTLIFKNVPAKVCQNCGEEYLEDKITSRLLQIAEEALKAGVQVDIREYIAA